MTNVETNVRASAVTRARRLLETKYRKTDNAFLAEGPQAVREAIEFGVVRELFITDDSADRYVDIYDAATSKNISITFATEEVIASLSSTVTPQGVVAVVQASTDSLDDIFTSDATLVVALAYVRDPGNAGSVIRVADAAGAQGVITSSESVDLHNPKVVRATAGSLFHLPLVEEQDIFAVIDQARSRGLQVLAADGSGQSFVEGVELAKPTLWVFGNEAWGLPEDVLTAVDQVVSIPIYGKAESMNLATAAAVCLYASAFAQRSNN